MKKNQETIQQIMEDFDEKLKKLFNLKIRTEMAIQEVSKMYMYCTLYIQYMYMCTYMYVYNLVSPSLLVIVGGAENCSSVC